MRRARFCENYRKRRDVLVRGPEQARLAGRAAQGNDVRVGQNSRAVSPLGSLEFSKKLLRDAKIAVSPGIGFGEHGDGHVRFSLIENEERTRQAIRGIRRMFEHG